MDAVQVQGAIVAWGAVLTTLIITGAGIVLALRSSLARLSVGHEANTAAIAAVATRAESHEQQLNGTLATLIASGVRAGMASRKDDVVGQ